MAAPVYFGVYQMGDKRKWPKLASQSEIMLELGSGPKKGTNGWTTVDLSGADINWDLRKGIPLKNNSVAKIYSSHLLEHIPYKELIAFLKECKRVLRTDGEFSVCVPNAGLTIREYADGSEVKIPEMPDWAAVSTGSRIDVLNYNAYMGGEHCYMFDEQNLVNTLTTAGFSQAHLREFEASFDLDSRRAGSIYAVAYKSAK